MRESITGPAQSIGRIDPMLVLVNIGIWLFDRQVEVYQKKLSYVRIVKNSKDSNRQQVPL